MKNISLTGDQLFWIIIIAIIGLVINWCVSFLILRNKEEQLSTLLSDGNILRMLTVIFVVFGTAVLAVLNVFNEAISAIFAGIVGYVLGSMKK